MKISLVAAIANNNALGKDNKLLWHLSNDLKFFKAYTLGKVIIMGRKTFESIGKRALPGRINVVISRDLSLASENIVVFTDLKEAIKKFHDVEEICIVGGAQIYQDSLSIADILVLTRVNTSPQADVYFPEVDFSQWKLVSEEKHPADERHQYDYNFQIWNRI